MVRAFSLTSDSLDYFIGFTLLHAEHTIFVSPWISNVELRFPVNNQLDNRRTGLLDALEKLDTNVTFVVQSGQEHNDFVTSRLPDHVTTVAVEDLHAKVVVCDEFAYVGSANITRGGLRVNREVCKVIENKYQDGITYVAEELNIFLPKS